MEKIFFFFFVPEYMQPQSNSEGDWRTLYITLCLQERSQGSNLEIMLWSASQPPLERAPRCPLSKWIAPFVLNNITEDLFLIPVFSFSSILLLAIPVSLMLMHQEGIFASSDAKNNIPQGNMYLGK